MLLLPTRLPSPSCVMIRRGMNTRFYTHSSPCLPRLIECEPREARQPAGRHRWPNKQRLQVNQSGAHPIVFVSPPIYLVQTTSKQSLWACWQGWGFARFSRLWMNETLTYLVAWQMFLVGLFPHSMYVLYFLVNLTPGFIKF